MLALDVREKYIRIGGALFFGVVLIFSAFFFKGSVPSSEATVLVADGPRSIQRTKDTDGDGIYDWEEEIAGTNPLVPNERQKSTSAYGAPSSELDIVPVTKTSRFTEMFLGKFIEESAGGRMSDEQKMAFVEDATTQVADATKDRPLTRADIRTTPSNDLVTLREYGNIVAEIMESKQVPDDNEVDIVKRALDADSEAELSGLDPIILAYQAMLIEIGSLQVPTSLSNEHLYLLNTLLTIHNDVVGMRNIFNDSLPGLVRVKRYDQDVTTLISALQSMRTALETRGVVYTESEPGIFFYSIEP